MNLDNVKRILRLLKNTDISEFQYENDGEKIKIKRGGFSSSGEVNVQKSEAEAVVDQRTVSEEIAAEADGQRLFTVTSPIVGSFYRAPSPDDSSFVEVGMEVRKGQVLCIIEAMKLMNEIESEVDGIVARILVENNQPVEYGEPLFLIDPK
ncbi:biotin carboxyl carrier protein of acetyl-CoA carboxylase [bacterium BMS3Abin07]|nr:biotin carboxyl carrier protein of acetyl-CoA carboxylase [bacterium BMS3Abin07]GBE33462.1 biotin carboxyl carrier protein of acetyl-CoA carboxylase [bacterium BMS3Bbin05]HDO22744.1 acetyl-CoA carboxylase biotin carboxyl carrier protein [Nitrospirota bacterium]HDZ88238.1 acetyl-CoA carboxylase biotin carboxyl carrier protein [Nitrospirota bacterium]